jgi:hypothetical protein
MVTILKDNIVTARKPHRCTAVDLVWEMVNQGVYRYSEYKNIIRLQRNKFLIQQGEKHRSYTVVDGGDIYTMGENLAMHEMCVKYDLYEEY